MVEYRAWLAPWELHAGASVEERMQAAENFAAPAGWNLGTPPEILEFCLEVEAGFAERAGDPRFAAWLRTLTTRVRRIEGLTAGEHRYVLWFRRGGRVHMRNCRPFRPRSRRAALRLSGLRRRRYARLVVTAADLDDEGLSNLLRLLRTLERCEAAKRQVR